MQNVSIDNDATSPSRQSHSVDRARDSELVGRIRADDPGAFGLLYDLWFDRLFNLVFGIVRDSGIAAEVTQDAFLSAWRKLHELQDPASFGGWLLRIGRNGALNRTKREARSFAIDDHSLAMAEQRGGSPASAPPGFSMQSHLNEFADPASAVADAQVVTLVREAASTLGARDREVLELQLHSQLSPAEIGEVLGMNRNAANQLCHRVRGRFAFAFGARMLWGNGSSRCEVLRRELADHSIATFDSNAVRVVSRHADTCDVCEEDRRTRLSPAALFASAPVVPVALAIRAHIAHGLGEAGVPMSGSSAVSAAGSGGEGIDSHGTSEHSTNHGEEQLTKGSTDPLSVDPAQANIAVTTVHSRASARITRRTVVALGVAAGIIALVGYWLVRPDTDQSTRLIARDTPAASLPRAASDLKSSSPSMQQPADTRVLPLGPQDGPAPTAAPPPTPTPTTVPEPTATTMPGATVAPQPIIETFQVTPATSRPNTYLMVNAPKLTWSVINASDVTIWLWYDDGILGNRRIGIAETGADGSTKLCPGTQPVPGTCNAASGQYRYELVATAADGTQVTAPERPGFDVVTPIIG